MVDLNKFLPEMYQEAPKLLIAHTWYGVLFVTLIYVIVAIVTAHRHTVEGDGDESIGFGAIWSMLLLVLVGACGTYILRRERNSPLLIGFVVGVAGMMANLQFIIFAIFASIANESDDGKEVAANKAMATFSFLSTIVHVLFTVALVSFKSAFLGEASGAEEAYNDGSYDEKPKQNAPGSTPM